MRTTIASLLLGLTTLLAVALALLVVAESPESFDGWLARQRQPAPEPATDLAKRGQAIVVNGTCGMCHAITGTQANAQQADATSGNSTVTFRNAPSALLR